MTCRGVYTCACRGTAFVKAVVKESINQRYFGFKGQQIFYICLSRGPLFRHMGVVQEKMWPHVQWDTVPPVVGVMLVALAGRQ